MRKRIVFVNSSLTGGGSERVMSLVANYCAENECDVEMLLLREKERTFPVVPEIRVVQFKSKLGKIRLLLSRLKRIRQEVKQFNADTVVAFMDDISLFTVLALVGTRKKIVISVRNDPNRPDKRVYYYITKYITMPLVQKIVFQTEQAMRCFGKIGQMKGVVIPNPINAEIEGEWDGIESKEIVAIGRIVPQKRYDIIIDAFQEFHEDHPEYFLSIYGDGPELERYKSLVNSKDASGYVSFKGFHNDVLSVLKEARAYISCSDFEGISNTMIEALAVGVPTICTDCPIGGAAMMINDCTNGLLIPVNNVKAAAEALRKVVDDEGFSLTISHNAVRVRSKYSMRNIGEKWMGVL